MTTPNTSKNEEKSLEHSRLSSDVYFLIQRFLSTSTLQRTLQTLNEELKEQKVLPKRIDWMGHEHDRSVEDMEQQYPYIHRDFLYFLCQQGSSSLNANHHKTPSFLSFRPRVRNRDGILHNYNQFFNYVTKIHGAPIQKLKEPINIVNNIRGREITGPLSRGRSIQPVFYKDIHIQRTTIGHLSAVYCLLFDHTGDFVITGADDLLIKMWSTHTARLIMVFRGASSEIADIAIDPENTLLAAGSLDKILRVWNMQTGTPVAVLTGQPGMITSVNFCPTPCWSSKYLISTGTDGSVAFWTYNHDSFGKAEFRNTPTLYQEKMRPGVAQMICSSFSPGGTFLATGSADHHVRVYYMKGDEGPQRILETEAHTDRVDSMQWAHSGLKFLSGSKDGTAIIWWFERQQWKSIHLMMMTKLPGDLKSDGKVLRVTMVAWDYSDSIVITAVSDHTLKVWKASDGQLLKVLTGHKDEVYVLESHPLDEDVLLSAGHDGQLFVWDVNKGKIVAKYLNEIDGQGHGAIYDAKWSPDGSKIAASDSHGDILTFGFGSGSTFYEELPKELFFHTDYRPLVRDQNYWVLDEQTQVPPHLMPPPFLVDMDGNPYPPMLQRLVPGRENCNLEQLVPNIVIGNGGTQEVIQDVPRRLLEESDDEDNRANQQQRSQRIRQSTGNWQSDPNMEWQKHILIPPLNYAVLERSNEIRECHSKYEMQEYQRQLRQRPHMISTAMPSSSKLKDRKKLVRPKGSRKPKSPRGFRVLTREEIDNLEIAPDSPVQTEDSSGYSDWMEENEMRKERKSTRRNNHNRQSRRKSRRKRRTRRSSDELETDTDTEANETDSDSGSSNDSSHSEDKHVNVCDDTDDSSRDEDSQDGENGREGKSEKKRLAHRNNKVPRPSRPNSKTNSPKPQTPKPSTSVTKANSVPKSPAPKVTVNSSSTAGPSTSGISSCSSSSKQTNKGPKIKKSENYKLSEWLSETKPKKSPYFPQLHDEIVYFVQGHQLYVEAVRMKNVYQENITELPWVLMQDLKDHEFCKVIDIQYQIKPPRLCCLKLAIQTEDSQQTGKVFSVRYHDMPDVLDFFVLKQTYTTAISRNWKIGDKFRCMIDDNWWMGYISNKSPACDVFPDSSFMCYEITWTNGEKERMSPWDMEPIDEQRLPEDEKAAIPVLDNELTAILYKSIPEDWPDCERDTACKAISRGITQVMELAIAEPFLVPVDINVYPTYARVIEYPIDLSTIKGRFENNFYRRLEAATYDIGYLKTNAEKFNEKHSIIIKHARILTNLCLEIAKSGNNHIDIASVYHNLVDEYESPSSETSDAEDTDVVVPKKEPESLPSTSRSLRSFPARSWKVQADWKTASKQLLDIIYKSEDSVPFQAPVDQKKYPTYNQLIQKPMDLSIVGTKLSKNQYAQPQDFVEDMRLIFLNSKTFNTNKRSLIYIMTVRLSTLFEDHMKKILNNWRQQKKRQRRRHTFSEDESDVSVSTADKSETADPPFIAEDKRSVENSDSDDMPLDVVRAKSLSQTNTESDSNSRSSERLPLVVKKPTKRKVLQSESDDQSQTEEEEYKPPSGSKVLRNMVTSEEEEESSQSQSDSDTRPRKSGLRQRPKRNRNYTQSDSDDDETLAKFQRKKRQRLKQNDSDVENASVNGGTRLAATSPPVQTETSDKEHKRKDHSESSDAESSTSKEKEREKDKLLKGSRKKITLNTPQDNSGTNASLRVIRKPTKTSPIGEHGIEPFLLNKNPSETDTRSKLESPFYLQMPECNVGVKTPPIDDDIYSDNSCNVSIKRSDNSELENQLSNISGDDSLFNEGLDIQKLNDRISGINNNISEMTDDPCSNGNDNFIDINIDKALLSNNIKSELINCLIDKSELTRSLPSQNDRVVTCYMLPTTTQGNDNEIRENNSPIENSQVLEQTNLEETPNKNTPQPDNYEETLNILTSSDIHIGEPLNGVLSNNSELENVKSTDLTNEDSEIEEEPSSNKVTDNVSVEYNDQSDKASEFEEEPSSNKVTDNVSVEYNDQSDKASTCVETDIMSTASTCVEADIVSCGNSSNLNDENCDLHVVNDNTSVSDNENQNLSEGDEPMENMSDFDQNSNRSPLNSDVSDSPEDLSTIDETEIDLIDPFLEATVLENEIPIETSSITSEGNLSDSFDPLSAVDNQSDSGSSTKSTVAKKPRIEVDNIESEDVEEEEEHGDSDIPSPDLVEIPIESVSEFINEDLEETSEKADPFSTVEEDIVDPFSDINDTFIDVVPSGSILESNVVSEDTNLTNIDHIEDDNLSGEADESEGFEEEDEEPDFDLGTPNIVSDILDDQYSDEEGDLDEGEDASLHSNASNNSSERIPTINTPIRSENTCHNDNDPVLDSIDSEKKQLESKHMDEDSSVNNPSDISKNLSESAKEVPEDVQNKVSKTTESVESDIAEHLDPTDLDTILGPKQLDSTDPDAILGPEHLDSIDTNAILGPKHIDSIDTDAILGPEHLDLTEPDAILGDTEENSKEPSTAPSLNPAGGSSTETDQPAAVELAVKKTEPAKRPVRRKVKKESDSDYEPSSSEWNSDTSSDSSSEASVNMSSEDGSTKSDKSDDSSSSDDDEKRESALGDLKKVRIVGKKNVANQEERLTKDQIKIEDEDKKEENELDEETKVDVSEAVEVDKEKDDGENKQNNDKKIETDKTGVEEGDKQNNGENSETDKTGVEEGDKHNNGEKSKTDKTGDVEKKDKHNNGETSGKVETKKQDKIIEEKSVKETSINLTNEENIVGKNVVKTVSIEMEEDIDPNRSLIELLSINIIDDMKNDENLGDSSKDEATESIGQGKQDDESWLNEDKVYTYL